MIGARVKQARLLAGLTQQELADRLGEQGYRVTKAAISKYENSKSTPPAQFLLLASTVLNVRSTYFTHQPARTIEWQAFRRHSQLPQKKQAAIKAYAVDIAELQIELHSLLYPEMAFALPSVAVSTFEAAEAAAEHLRDEWDLGNRPLDKLVQTAEDRGVAVIKWDDESGKFDGLSGWCGKYPVTVINTSRSADRIRFSLAHEIGHLVMDTSAISAKDGERMAHRFAAAFLVPAEHARHELGQTRRQLDLGELKMLKRKYGLSMAAWIHRAKDLDIINKYHYTELCKKMSAQGWRKKEPAAYQGNEEPLRLHQMALRAVANGLMSPDRITRVGVECFESESAKHPAGDYPTASQLLAMEQNERERWISQMFEWAGNAEFEIFEAYGEEEF